MEYEIIKLAQEVISREPWRRPEADWIQQKVDDLAAAEGIESRAETDSLIYEKMYARAPKKTDVTKIRYWRTGHHLPASREEALRFAGALQMDERERLYFLQACMEKSDVVYEKIPDEEAARKEYERRTALMETMISEYIAAVPAHRMFQLDISYENLAAHARHLYCIDALSATAFPENLLKKEVLEQHFCSNNYEAEFLRIRRFLGEIPRRTILRQTLLMGVPYLNRRLVDERLIGLGYLPLTEGHTSPRGALVDDLVIGFLKLYEETCGGEAPLVCRNWVLEQFQRLDRYLLDCRKEEYRIFYFRILSTMLGYGETR